MPCGMEMRTHATCTGDTLTAREPAHCPAISTETASESVEVLNFSDVTQEHSAWGNTVQAIWLTTVVKTPPSGLSEVLASFFLS